MPDIVLEIERTTKKQWMIHFFNTKRYNQHRGVQLSFEVHLASLGLFEGVTGRGLQKFHEKIDFSNLIITNQIRFFFFLMQ